MSLLIKCATQVDTKIKCLQQDERLIKHLDKVQKQSDFIKNAKLNLVLYKFEPDLYIELLGENEVSSYQETYDQLRGIDKIKEAKA